MRSRVFIHRIIPVGNANLLGSSSLRRFRSLPAPSSHLSNSYSNHYINTDARTQTQILRDYTFMVPRIVNCPSQKGSIPSCRSYSSTSYSHRRDHSHTNSYSYSSSIFRLLSSSSSLSSSDANRNNNLETRRKDNAKTSDKLRDILNNLGMSISQWKIQDNDDTANTKTNSQNMINFDLPSSTKGNTRKARRQRSSRQGQHVNPYLHSQTQLPRRSRSTEYDVYSNSNSNINSNNYARTGAQSATRQRRNHMTRTDDVISARLKVKAIHAASNFNIAKVLTTVFGPTSTTPALNHVFGKQAIIVQLPAVTREAEMRHGSGADEFFHLPDSHLQPRYVAIFRFGSIVFFNLSAKDAGDILEAAKKYAVDPVPRGFERKEHFEIAIAPNMQDTAHVNADFATVKELNINNVAIVSTIMGQTVAFDSYNDTVDELLATFESINATVKRTGNCTAMERETLFKVVAQNNSLFIEMIARLGIKDRSDTAWNLSQYERLHEGMKHEFEIDPRFEHMEFKLNLIQQNAKFFIDILHDQKSDTLEWIIIVLISFECLLMLMEMSGLGPSLLHNGGALNAVHALSLPPAST